MIDQLRHQSVRDPSQVMLATTDVATSIRFETIDVMLTAGAGGVTQGLMVSIATGPSVLAIGSLATTSNTSLVAIIPETTTCVTGNQNATRQQGASNTQRRIVGIALETKSVGEKVRVRLRGAVYASVTSSVDIGYGEGMLIATAGGILINATTYPGTPSGTVMFVGVPLESTGTTNALKRVLFDGIQGFGTCVV